MKLLQKSFLFCICKYRWGPGCICDKNLMSQYTWKAFTMRVKRISSVTFMRKIYSIKEPLINYRWPPFPDFSNLNRHSIYNNNKILNKQYYHNCQHNTQHFAWLFDTSNPIKSKPIEQYLIQKNVNLN